MIVPATLHAVLVGVEKYDFGPGGDLTGPVEDAARMAGLLREAGVPAGRIDVLGSGDDLYRYFNAELRRHAAEALVVYWSGHGFEFDRRQWLCLPGASMTDLQAVDFTGELMPTLAGASYRFPEQFFFVDACRTRYHRAQLPTGPIGRRFAPSGGSARRDQHALLAAPSGAAAANLPSLRTGAFTRALIAALAEQEIWPWRMDEVVRSIGGSTGLPPIEVTMSRPTGERSSVVLGGAIDPAELSHLLSRVPGMTRTDRLHRVVLELEITHDGLRLGDVESPEELVWTLHRSLLGLGPLLRLARARADYFPDVPATRNLIRALEDHCAG